MNIKIADSHTDFLTELKTKEDRKNYIEQCKKNGVKVLCCAVFTTNKKIGLNEIKNFYSELKILENLFNIKLLLTIEDIGFIKDENELKELIKIKPFSVTLTWNYKNKFAGGALTNKGLTPFGIKAIKLFEQNKILIDTAHLSKKSFYEFCSLTTLPIFNSHSNIFSLYSHVRNLTDKQIKKIVSSGGFMGLTLYNKFILNSKITSVDIAKQFDYLIKKIGKNNFGFGTDFYGIDFSCTPINVKGYGDFKKIYDALLNMGYDKHTINKIMFKSFENFINRIN